MDPGRGDGAGPGVSRVAAEATGQLSLLEDLIAPFGGRRARPLARRLLARFGSLRALVSASGEALAAAAGEDAAVAARMEATRRLHDAALRETLTGARVHTNDPEFQAYLSRRLGNRREECILVVFLDEGGLFVAEDFYPGTRRSGAAIPARPAIRRALELDARRIVLSHNHPSGRHLPSQDDIAATREFRRLLAALEIALEDHCIVAGNRVSSMRALGML